MLRRREGSLLTKVGKLNAGCCVLGLVQSLAPEHAEAPGCLERGCLCGLEAPSDHPDCSRGSAWTCCSVPAEAWGCFNCTLRHSFS